MRRRVGLGVERGGERRLDERGAAPTTQRLCAGAGRQLLVFSTRLPRPRSVRFWTLDVGGRGCESAVQEKQRKASLGP